MVASATSPFSRPSASRPSITSRKPCSLCDGQFDQHVPGMRLPAADRGTRRRGGAPFRGRAACISSKLVTLPPARCVAMPEQCRARLARDGSRRRRFRRRAAAARSRSTAAVITSKRSFGADEQVFQIVAGIVLLQLVEVVENAAVGQHHLDPEHVRPRDAVGKRGGAAGIGRKIAADGAAAFRRQQLRIKPVGTSAAASRARCKVTPASQVIVFEAGSTLADAVEPVSDRTISLLSGICPPTRPVLPPCGTIGVEVSLASLRICATSATEPGRSTIGVRPRYRSRISTT